MSWRARNVKERKLFILLVYSDDRAKKKKKKRTKTLRPALNFQKIS